MIDCTVVEWLLWCQTLPLNLVTLSGSHFHPPFLYYTTPNFELYQLSNKMINVETAHVCASTYIQFKHNTPLATHFYFALENAAPFGHQHRGKNPVSLATDSLTSEAVILF